MGMVRKLSPADTSRRDGESARDWIKRLGAIPRDGLSDHQRHYLARLENHASDVEKQEAATARALGGEARRTETIPARPRPQPLPARNEARTPYAC
jgi:hypothetical protein